MKLSDIITPVCTMKTAHEKKAEAYLNVKRNYIGLGVVTRAEWLKQMKQNGGMVDVIKIRQYDKEEKEKERLSKMAFSIPFGNEHHPETIEYLKRKAELKSGFYKEVYTLNNIVITKTEYNYFKSL